MTQSIFSPRLLELAGEIAHGDAPNLGRFCGHCYAPLEPQQELCGHCQGSVQQLEPVASLPAEVLAILVAQRRREAVAVHGLATLGLALGATAFFASLVALPAWWKLASIGVLLLGPYPLALLLGGWLGDALGYRWGQQVAGRMWQEFLARRDKTL